MNVPVSPYDLRCQLRLAAIRADISGRLWRVNAGMESAAYNQLVDQMAQAQFAGERRQAEQGMEMNRRLALPYAPDR